MKKENFGNSRKCLGQKNQDASNFEISALEARDASIKLLEQQLAHQEDWVNYWKNKYEKCLEELKKETTRWWRF